MDVYLGINIWNFFDIFYVFDFFVFCIVIINFVLFFYCDFLGFNFFGDGVDFGLFMGWGVWVELFEFLSFFLCED